MLRELLTLFIKKARIGIEGLVNLRSLWIIRDSLDLNWLFQQLSAAYHTFDVQNFWKLTFCVELFLYFW